MTALLSRPPEGPVPEAGVGRAPQTVRSRWYWRNWPVVVKLAAVLLVPTIVALVAGILRIVDQADAAPGYARITQIARVQQQLSDLIGSVARERGIAAAFVATGRVGDRQVLDAQFRAVDDNVRLVTDAAGQVQGLDFARTALGELGGLAPLRASVTTGFGPVEVVVSEYSDAIDPLIQLDAALTRQLDDVAVTDNAAAAHDLLVGREQVSRQHAIVSGGLYLDRLSPGQIEDLRTATVRLATQQDAVRSTLAPAERAAAIAGIGPDAELSRQRILQLVLNRALAGQPLNTPPQDWDQRNAVVVDNIANVEAGLRQRVEQTAQGLFEQVRTTAGLNAVILFFALALGVLVGVMVTRALLRPLGVLKRTALDVADRRLPEAMARIRDGDAPAMAIEPVPVATREEIGQVARAFDEVHSQAVRLATEQAQLRSSVNDIFVNLSRRTQGLVERQLKLIDRLESGEQDPKQLENLFQLDHLATRMRRNSENLLVLAGTEATNRSGRPVRLIDVLRAAVSEVEQYQRLVLQQPPAVLVLGRSASDLVHLLAELLDNATQFSPPDSHVMVSSELAADGGVAIEVVDRGVGMTEEELAEANQRLASPAAVDASVSRRMGLFVVGRLAGRHGIEVQLRRGEAGVGIGASVLMPSRLVRVAVEPTETQGAVVGETPGPEIPAPESPAPESPDLETPDLETPDPETPDPEVTATGAPATNGPLPGSLVATLVAGRNGVPVPRPHTEPDAGAAAVEPAAAAEQGSGDEEPTGRPAEIDATADDTSGEASGSSAAGAEQTGDDDGKQPSGPPAASDPPAGSGLPRRKGNRPAPAAPPAPPGPPASPPVADSAQVPGAGSGADLFRPARASVAGPVSPGQRVTLQHSTPIFDDVASAWFKEHEVVPPVRWTAPPSRGTAGMTREAPIRQAPSPNAPLPDAPAADVAPAGVAPAPVAASATVGSPPLIRRQPGKTLAGSEPGAAGRPRPSGQPVAAPDADRPAGAAGWGAGDEGWRAVQALAQPVNAEVTGMGLPRRQPRAMLVPGAAGAAAEATSAPPVRSAEAVRGRLASYQQGIREGRQARESLVRNAGESAPAQPGGEEETT
ncbi:MAG: nitrate- and nitrite sensing domain-containing protein [Pseudonocardiaceae bacterium]